MSTLALMASGEMTQNLPLDDGLERQGIELILLLLLSHQAKPICIYGATEGGDGPFLDFTKQRGLEGLEGRRSFGERRAFYVQRCVSESM